MSEQPGQPIDAYLDGLLEARERTAFEHRLETDERLRMEVSVQRGIDSALGRLFSPPKGEGAALRIITQAMIAPRTVVRAPAQTPAWRRFAVAAVLILGVVGVYRIWDFLQPRPVFDPYAPQPWRSFEKVYRDTLAGGFKPAWVCRNDEEFMTAFRRGLGQALLLFPPPPGAAWAGLDYCNSITPRTMVLLAWVEGKEVIVLADQAEFDKPQSLPAESGLNLFRRQVGNLVLYECTPLDMPLVLGQFYIPDIPGP